MVPYVSTPVARVLLAFLARHLAKNKVPEKCSPRAARKVSGPKIKFTIRYFHIDYNAPNLPSKILHYCRFQFLLGIRVVPRERQSLSKIWGRGGGRKQGCIVVYVKMVNSLGRVRESNPGPLAP